ncbi:unnamed protein product [Boreogadus saida]
MILRLQRFNVIYKRGRELYVADALSRAHLPSTDQAEEVEEYEVVAAGWPDTFREGPRDLRPLYAMRGTHK